MADLPTYTPGQRWVSESEPELGLGTVLSVEGRRVMVVFPASGETRLYAVAQAPLNRVRYTVGDTVTDGAAQGFVVERVAEANGLLTYFGEGRELFEGGLSDQLSFNRPQDRLLNGQVDRMEAFALRQQVLEHQHRYRSSPLRGLLGGRIALIPHQLYVVESVVQRPVPRVLLSDEIGLGKTIEACLILHRKLMLGRIRRALILVPGALIHQWFVELLRRFSLKVAIFDEARCEAIEANAESGNPFLEDQLILADVDWLAAQSNRAMEAVQAGWDLLIVDEAHHLEWVPDADPGETSAGYHVVEALARASRGLLLLTATPEEMGVTGHFARLRLLDPDRYTSLEAFEQENAGYARLVPLVETLEGGHALTKVERRTLKELGLDPGQEREALLHELIDCYGPGRVIFRNTRRIIKGFPERRPHLVPLADDPDALLNWIIALMRNLAPEKVLAIVHTRKQAQKLYDAVKENSGIKVSLFHEGMNLLQRDRQAAWFADPEGARLLVASEIGGEGRNFQFAHHLVLLDMPENPEIIEQRIGRLDRIGQRDTIHIHVPVPPGSRDESVARWMHDGLDALRQPLPGAHALYLHFKDRLEDASLRVGAKGWSRFIEASRKQRAIIADKLAHGRDRLLELQSYRGAEARHWVEAIAEADADPALETFLLALFEAHGVHPERLGPRLWLLKPDPLFSEYFPGFPREGMTITFDRNRALEREDMGFMSWDHPLVHGAMERVLASVEGNTAVAVTKAKLDTAFLVEAVFVLEAVSSEGSDAVRYLPGTPLRVRLDDTGAACKGFPEPVMIADLASIGEAERERIRETLPGLLIRAESLAADQAEDTKKNACARLQQEGEAELSRLHILQKRNAHITEAEIVLRTERVARTRSDIIKAPLRLDALRWIWCMG